MTEYKSLSPAHIIGTLCLPFDEDICQAAWVRRVERATSDKGWQIPDPFYVEILWALRSPHRNPLRLRGFESPILETLRRVGRKGGKLPAVGSPIATHYETRSPAQYLLVRVSTQPIFFERPVLANGRLGPLLLESA